LRNFSPKCYLLTVIILMSAVRPLAADELRIEIHGVSDPLLTNVRSSVEPFRLTQSANLNQRQLEDRRLSSEQQAMVALRPFGYYSATVRSEISSIEDGIWLLDIHIDPGPPVRITDVSLEIHGPGARLADLVLWESDWPLVKGKTLNQQKWDKQKQRALDISEENGYLLATFSQVKMEVDLDTNEASLGLVLETGEQAVMGDVIFRQDWIKPHVLENLARFRSGDPYNSWLMDKFRVDVWRTGYFNSIEIVEDRHLQESPPRVDLTVNLEPRTNNTYQGTLGYGSDTGPRILFSWNRHLISSRGDNFALGTGWQERNNEYFVRGNYRLPRISKPKQSWIADVLLRNENQDIEVSDGDFDDIVYNLGNSTITDYSLRLGRLRVYDRRRGFRQLFETMYAEVLNEKTDFQSDLLLSIGPEVDDIIEVSQRPNSNSLSFGIEYDMPMIRGEGFETVGYRHRARAFISNESWGSDEDFHQIYLSSRWNLLVGRRWKLLLRGEIGYSDADVHHPSILIDNTELRLSITDLPNIYRFKAGGSNSIRGYGFESISNNGIGSNNIITASAEVEYRVLNDWSAAAFFDIGDAFNEWKNVKLFKGAGVGIRWYSIAGAIRLDLAQGLDHPDKPWRIHFSIGISVL
jgi:translocation and assembly module TamA